MTVLAGFVPFFLFATVESLAGLTAGLLSGLAASLLMIIHDWVRSNRKVKVLEIGTALIFGGLAVYSLVTDAPWSIVAVRLRVDIGLLLIAVVSMAIRTPFTVQYAREQVPEKLWSNLAFLRTNYIITSVWAGAFVVMVAADMAMLYVPSLPMAFGIWATVLAIVGAAYFTKWFSEREIVFA